MLTSINAHILMMSLAVVGTIFSTASAMANDHFVGANWSGFFVGINGGGARQDSSARYDSNGDDTRVSPNLEGGVIGVHGGYRHQFGNVVLGIIGDYAAIRGSDETLDNDAMASSDEVTLDSKDLWSVRGELGYAVGNFLLFGTLGIGGADYEVRSVTPDSGSKGSISDDEEGVVYGAGVE